MKVLLQYGHEVLNDSLQEYHVWGQGFPANQQELEILPGGLACPRCDLHEPCGVISGLSNWNSWEIQLPLTLLLISTSISMQCPTITTTIDRVVVKELHLKLPDSGKRLLFTVDPLDGMAPTVVH